MRFVGEHTCSNHNERVHESTLHKLPVLTADDRSEVKAGLLEHVLASNVLRLPRQEVLKVVLLRVVPVTRTCQDATR